MLQIFCDGPYSSYGYKDTHGMTGEFTWGFDGWIYACHGFSNTSTVKGSRPHPSPAGEEAGTGEITMQSGNTYRFKEDGSRIEYFTHGQVNPFGLAFDPLGNVFSCDCHTRPLYQLLRGAWYPSFGKPHDGLGFGPEMVTHSHGSTAIAGIAYYADDAFPPEFRDNLFIGNVVTNRINRDRLDRHGSTFKGIEMPDFVRCDDRWFRPVDIKLGPDGALYVADFYNRIIGHYEVPLTHPGRDRSHGRIWRIVHRGADGKPKLHQVRDLYKASVEELITELNNPNIGVRIQATNQLVERGKEGVGAIVPTLSPRFLRAQAFWALARLGFLKDDPLATSARDADPLVRVHLQRILAERPGWSKTDRQLAVEALKDSDAFVQRAAADALGRHPHGENLAPLLDLRHRVPSSDTHLLHVIRMALRDHMQDDILTTLADAKLAEADSRALADACLGMRTPASAAFVLQHLQKYPEGNPLEAFSHHAVRYGDSINTDRLLAFGRDRLKSAAAQATMLRAVHKAMQELGKKLDGEHYEQAAVLTRRLVQSASDVERQIGIELAGELKIADVQGDVAGIARDKSAAEPQRRAACTALTQIDADRNADALFAILLSISEPSALREHVARTLAQSNRAGIEARAAKSLEVLPARLQAAIAEGLASSKSGAHVLLDAVARGKASARLLQDRNIENRLKISGVPNLLKRIAALTRGLPAADAALQQLLNRRQQGFVAAKADIKQGLLVFEKNCASCHQLQNKGNKIGPQLDGIGIRGLERLLEDVLDPNRNVDQEFRATTLSLNNGQVVVGLLLRQEGQILVLADSQGKQLRIPVDDIETRIISQLSPMPSNHAEQIGETDFYHLLHFLLEQK